MVKLQALGLEIVELRRLPGHLGEEGPPPSASG
jgi:hypothetical protein